ncbi:DUF6694 family lipoprotein [Xenorhabdus szentirmaii]|uniref:Lipoprotein n=1 Tax=Xenorhabdus szentirmaii DSM 16338 TaxID=1427518 RepID=W1J7W3_9GAMM|nr:MULTISPECIES: DUF6694 family lipoprotein [Xenorhabdus]MBD2782171.1 hypothetical protein [Xenorhabdus sp. 38]MBD2793829.1 hypothetical protein [Xenorhabdus sp. CUL]MBD2805544.1 hypothetical protein [Xenorhabdus sp. ZM]MBD2821666.1 hypothetical protein [Xenorhabdus sp. 42]MBD2823913.1 hypothetical protein [Xenorhabdus sp. 5]
MRKLLVICFLGFVLTGCDNPLRVDGSNEITVKMTIEKIRDSLSEDKKLQFDDALNITMLNSIDFDDLLKDNKNSNSYHINVDKLEQKFIHSLHGKTADQIIEDAERIKSENKHKIH